MKVTEVNRKGEELELLNVGVRARAAGHRADTSSAASWVLLSDNAGGELE